MKVIYNIGTVVQSGAKCGEFPRWRPGRNIGRFSPDDPRAHTRSGFKD